MKEDEINKELLENTSSFWDNLYMNHDTGWDMKQVSPPLKGYIESIENKELKILIPGCGNAYEAEYLLQNQFENVTLIDISRTLTDHLSQKFTNRNITIINDNFFNHSGEYDLILEQTFFCALEPGLRSEYVEKCYNLLKENGRVAGVLFNKKRDMPGPPFTATNEEYIQLFSTRFQLNIFEDCYNSIKPRMGTELFFELEKNKQ